MLHNQITGRLAMFGFWKVANIGCKGNRVADVGSTKLHIADSALRTGKKDGDPSLEQSIHNVHNLDPAM